MDLSSWVPVVALLPPALAATYPVLRDRSHHLRIERLNQMLKSTDDSNASLTPGETAVILAVRRRSIVAIGTALGMRPYAPQVVLGVSFGIYTVSIIGSMFLLGKVQFTGWQAAVSWSIAVAFGLLSSVLLWTYDKRRDLIEEAVEKVVGTDPLLGLDDLADSLRARRRKRGP